MSEKTREILTMQEVAKCIGACRNTVSFLAKTGIIPHLQIGKRLVFHRSEVQKFLQKNCIQASK